MAGIVRTKCTFYESFKDALSDLDDLDRLAVYDAVFDYQFYGITPELNGVQATVWKLIKPQIDANNKRFDNGKKGGRPNQDETKHEPSGNQDVTKPEPNKKEKEEVKEEVKKKREKIPRERSAFQKPTIEEIKDYCSKRENTVNASQFYDFYESKGWVIGNQKMKDWKAAVRTWERRKNERGSPQNVCERSYTDEQKKERAFAAYADMEELANGI